MTTIPRRIFCIWSGDNEMSDNRKKCLELIRQNSQTVVDLVTPANLSDWIKDPLHDSYDYLSLTHKADYLRCYLMYHYGSGYCDIKPIFFSWQPYFDILENSFFDFIGYSELSPLHIASDIKEIQSSYSRLCGCCHFIFKPKSSFAAQWLSSVNTILDKKIHLLKKFPGTYHPRAIFGGVHHPEIDNLYKDSQYPLCWNEILGQVIHKLMYNNFGDYTSGMPYVNLTSQYR